MTPSIYGNSYTLIFFQKWSKSGKSGTGVNRLIKRGYHGAGQLVRIQPRRVLTAPAPIPSRTLPQAPVLHVTITERALWPVWDPRPQRLQPPTLAQPPVRASAARAAADDARDLASAA